MQPEDTCSAHALVHGEDLLGTGVDGATHWVGVEYRGAWRPKAVLDNDLSEPVRDWLRGLKGRSDCRPVLVKRRGKRDGVTVWYANVVEGRVHRFDLEDHTRAPALPWDALFDGTTEAGRSQERPLFVCTHSGRDHCCGLYGAGVARALEKAAPGRVWQCTHLGGHRFAATLVALPEGVHYGRVRREQAAALITALDDGRIHDPQHLRGLTRYPVAVQAAVDTVRRERGLNGIDAIVATGWQTGEDGTVVELEAAGEPVRAVVKKQPMGVSFPKSCGAESSAGSRWQVVLG